MNNKVVAVIKSLLTKKIPTLDGFTAEFYKNCEELIPSAAQTIPQNTKRNKPKFYEASIIM
jgi:hypothetical protein